MCTEKVETTEQSRPGRPKSRAKRRDILEAAGRLFLQHGLQGASMDAVAREAGVSKQTVYSHFDGKEALFSACIRTKVSEYGFEAAAVPPPGEARAALLGLLKGFMSLIVDPEVVAMHRVVAAEAASHPRIAALFFEAGPLATRDAVRQLLAPLIARGDLRPHDTTYAAWQLLNMAMGDFHIRLQFGLLERVPEAELDAHLQRVVDDFLGLYAARPEACS